MKNNIEYCKIVALSKQSSTVHKYRYATKFESKSGIIFTKFFSCNIKLYPNNIVAFIPIVRMQSLHSNYIYTSSLIFTIGIDIKHVVYSISLGDRNFGFPHFFENLNNLSIQEFKKYYEEKYLYKNDQKYAQFLVKNYLDKLELQGFIPFIQIELDYQ